MIWRYVRVYVTEWYQYMHEKRTSNESENTADFMLHLHTTCQRHMRPVLHSVDCNTYLQQFGYKLIIISTTTVVYMFHVKFWHIGRTLVSR